TEQPGPFTLAISGPGVISSLLRRPTPDNLVEHYAAGRIDFQGGDLMAFMSAARAEHLGRRFRQVSKWYLCRQVWRFLLHAPDRSVVSHATDYTVDDLQRPQRNRPEFIEFHYDEVPTEAYRLFLDAELVYSCGYFTDPHCDLDQAQQDKLEMICRKLRLQPGDRFLDIGCGWGGLLCYAARNYGVRAHGVTLSRQQFAFTEEKIRRLGLDGRVTVALGDYSDVEGTYDKIASVGMMEHVGIANYPAYFGKLSALLRDRGMLLNHCIARPAKKTAAAFRKSGRKFRLIGKYIFPGGELDHIGHTLEVMEGHRFEVHDVEAWRTHYARTCELWCQRLTARRDEAIPLMGEEKYRLWVAYLAASSFGFQDGVIRIFQTVATKHAKKGPSGMPATRRHLYDRIPAGETQAA
ncbi:MAG TPA: cyclopropane-fatty-acyl-phospholipid synthase family protein, partial [Gemmataceae bacterium]|nr:cyclopropane-fatty-acyl-phospholipid synthase family protein [Gemmataceae bacterium]